MGEGSWVLVFLWLFGFFGFFGSCGCLGSWVGFPTTYVHISCIRSSKNGSNVLGFPPFSP